MIKTIALLCAGTLLFVLAFPPADLGFLGFVAIVPFILAFDRISGRMSWLAAYLAGTAVFLVACSWVGIPTPVNLIFVAVFQGWFLPLFGLLLRIGTRRGRLPVWLCAPVAWTAVEYVRASFPLDGFPWLLLGYTSWRIPPLLQTADLFGVWGPGFIMALCSGVIAHYILRRASSVGSGTTGDKVAAGNFVAAHGGTVLFSFLLAAALAYGTVRPGGIELEKGPVLAAVQGNIPQHLKWNNASYVEVHARYLAATSRLMNSATNSETEPAPDLVIWPETIYRFPISEGEEGEVWFPEDGFGDAQARKLERQWIAGKFIHETTGPAGAWFLVGAESFRLGPEGDLERRNSVFLYDPEGNRRSSYSKAILVVGGEYLPLVDWIPFGESIKRFVENIAGYVPDLKPGDGPRLHTLSVRGIDYDFGIQICLENAYGEYCRRFVQLGAQFMVNISNEGWYGESAEFDQMLAMSLFRAVETRRTLFRSTNTGISCMISPLGGVPDDDRKVVSNGRDRAVDGVLSCEVPVCTATTLFTLIGDAPGQAVMFVQVLLLLISFLRGRSVTIRSSADKRT